VANAHRQLQWGLAPLPLHYRVFSLTLKRLRIASGTLPLGNLPIHLENRPGEIKLLLDRPDLLMCARREELGRIAHRHPVDRNHRGGPKPRVDMDNAVNTNFGPCLKIGPIENCRPCCKEATTGPPSAVMMAPASMAVPSPMVTSPRIVAFGAM